MTSLPVGALFLYALINNTLYLQFDPSVQEAFICPSANNENNDTWPSSWKRMILRSGLHSYEFQDINKYSFVKYKLRLYYFNSTSVTTEDWIDLSTRSEECHCNTCIILFTTILVLFVCMLGYIAFKAYMYYR